MSMELERNLPDEFLDGFNYFHDELLRDNDWYRGNRGKYILIIDRDLIVVSNDYTRLVRATENHYAGSLYTPYVTRLGVPKVETDYRGEPLPRHFLEAQQYFTKVLRKNPEWLESHMGMHIAIVGFQVIGEAQSFHDLATEVHARYQHDSAMFMPEVTRKYPEVFRLGMSSLRFIR